MRISKKPSGWCFHCFVVKGDFITAVTKNCSTEQCWWIINNKETDTLRVVYYKQKKDIICSNPLTEFLKKPVHSKASVFDASYLIKTGPNSNTPQPNRCGFKNSISPTAFYEWDKEDNLPNNRKCMWVIGLKHPHANNTIFVLELVTAAIFLSFATKEWDHSKGGYYFWRENDVRFKNVAKTIPKFCDISTGKNVEDLCSA